MLGLRERTGIHRFRAFSMNQQSSLQRAVEFVGNQGDLARVLGCHQSLISQVLTGRRKLPVNLAIRIEAATYGRIRVEELRPDIEWEVVRRGGRAGRRTLAEACDE